MSQEVGSYDAKTKLPEILRRVEMGECFTITNRGKPVAELVPAKSANREKAQAAIENILKARKRTVSDADLSEMMETGRK